MDNVRRIFSTFIAVLASFALLASPTQPKDLDKPGEIFSVFEENGKVGLKNEAGRVVIPAQYEAIGWSNGKFSVTSNVTGYRSNGLWGLINIQNSRLTRPEFTDLVPGDGLTLIARKKIQGTVRIQTGCINTSGKEIVPFQYDGITIASPLRAVVFQKNGAQYKYGLIDFSNNILIPLQYRSIRMLGSLRYGVEDFNRKLSIFSEDGKQITPFVIDSLSLFKKNYAVIYQGLDQGLIDRDGIIKIEPVAGDIRIGDDGTIEVKKRTEWIFLDEKNNRVQSLAADAIAEVDEQHFKITSNGRTYLADKALKPVNGRLVQSIDEFDHGFARFKQSNHYGVLTKTGEIIVEPKFNDLIIDQNLFIGANTFESKLQWSLLDLTGKPKHTKTYDYIGKETENVFPVLHRGYWGILDKDGREIVACVHDSLVQLKNDLIVVKFRGKYGIIDHRENWVVTPQQNKLQIIRPDRYIAFNGKTTFIKSLKSEVIYFSDNPLVFQKDYILEHLPNGEEWKISYEGLIIGKFSLPEAVEVVFPETEGLRAIKKDGRFGFIDDRGRLRIANRYEDVKPFNEKFAAVKIRGRWGFIDHADELTVQPVYDAVNEFKNGLCIVKQKVLFGMIDTKGKLILPVRYESIQSSGNDYIIKQNGLLGLYDSKGVMIINPKYDHLEEVENGSLIIGQNGKFGVLSHEGMNIVPQVYDGLSFNRSLRQYIAVKKSDWEKIKL